ncbi:hypothetical protein FPOAC2_13404 [Fusarium poae]
MNNYFDDLCKIEAEKSDGNINNQTKRKTSKIQHNDFKEICVEAHIINSVSYTRENMKLMMTPMIDIMNDKRIYGKFLPILLGHDGFRTRAWLITENSRFKELYCRKKIRDVLDPRDSESSNGYEPRTSEFAEPVPTEIPQRQANKRSGHRDIYGTPASSQKRARKGTETHAETPIADNTRECLQEYQTPDVEDIRPKPDSRIAVSDLKGSSAPVQPVAVNDLESNRAHSQAKVPTTENTNPQEHHHDVRQLTMTAIAAHSTFNINNIFTCTS